MLDERQSHEGDRTRFLAAPPAGILQQTELTLPPTLLAARGSWIAARSSNIALAFLPLLRQGF